jgi:hypothetical protein
MPRDVLPSVELIKGPCKHILTKKAREAAEVPLKHVKLQLVKVLASASTVSGPAASTSLTVTSSSIPNIYDSILDTISKWITVCPTDYTNDNYNWGTDHYSLPLPSLPHPAPSSLCLPTQYATDDDANMINIDSDVDNVRVKHKSMDIESESIDAELGM